ncbi:MAG: DNA-3-methyladenine glycosylase [Candidatus Cyclobacteriaceae bacterium M2_1C_046]
MAKKLDQNFYKRKDVVQVAKDLIGKVLYTNLNGECVAGKIVETEAYSHIEKACHAYNYRRTSRTSVMYKEGGHAYVYLIYGIYELFNIVTNDEDIPEAVLIRGIEPVEGWEIMRDRRKVADKNLTSGPGKLTLAMGINRNLNGISLLSDKIWLEEDSFQLNENSIVETTRVGVDYAGEDALLPWRFYVKDNPFVSKK